jgi:hypothetical protein
MGKRNGKVKDVEPQFIIPSHVSKEMHTWITGLLGEWEFSAEDYKILLLGANAWDLAERCRKIIAQKSPTYIDRFGAPRSRPECAVLRDSRIGFLRCIAALNLVEEPPESEQEMRRPYTNPRRVPEWVRQLREGKTSAAQGDEGTDDLLT